MDIYYFYNGINNIIKLALKDKKYLANSKLILNDPLVILDFQYSSNLKGGAAVAATALKAVPTASKAGPAAKFAKVHKAKNAIGTAKVPGEATNTQEAESNSNSSNESSNNEDEEELSPKEKALKIIKVLFSIVYYLCLFSILPLLPFIAISYYSFKRLKIFYNEQMGTL
jgi:hypothetical protein